MCDTMAAHGAATLGGITLFAKNSDRERNEAQFLEVVPARRYGAGSQLRTTYLTIAQAARTHAVLLSRPFWIWGAEMGANEHGVVIGNEAVHPRALPQRRAALIGMDLLRLGLERGATAADAVEVITGLLEQHGQGGNCSHLGRRYYDNSFIVADAKEVFVLETVGRRWAVERAAPTRAISNLYTISEPTRMSHDLEAFSRDEGWVRGNKFDFAAAVTNPENPGVAGARARCGRSSGRLAKAAGRLDVAGMMAILRDHGSDSPIGHPQDIAGGSVCMHAADGARRGQSVGSLVSAIGAGSALHWVTGSAAPCTAVFKPVVLADGLPEQGVRPGDQYEPESLWWAHEALHRALLTDYAAAMPDFSSERDALESGFIARMASPDAVVVAQCWREAAAFEADWLRRLQGRDRLRPAYRASWARFDRLAGAALLTQAAPQTLAAE